MSSITSLGLAHLFIKNIFSKHGLPSSIPFRQEFPLLRSGRQNCDNEPVTNVMGSIPVGDKRRSQSNYQRSLGFPLHWCTRVPPLGGSL
ncbi:hypothetical protein O181_118541 [Austropuccinia psidii MF-1]|uniref:Uncharacterized protein n=1 Tax=Austropuccinia psidii MF-1 TaxID=1389203 RepID=A0A9Q3PYX2_9BASI|nr:hypothetical protein [Austropuccinia psidii MF-1]